MNGLFNFARKMEKLAVDNSPVLLTAVGVAGTVTTAVLAGKATLKADQILREHEEGDRPSLWRDAETPPTKLQKLGAIWPVYIPAAGTMVITVVAIVGANRIGARRAAAVAAAYSLSEKAFEEYREKIVEKLGESKERQARDEIAQDRVDRNPISQNSVILTGKGESPCYDVYSGRYFMSTMEDLKSAENNINYKIIHHVYASLNDYYDRLGIPAIEIGEEVGWTSNEILETFYSTTMTDDQRPAISIEFRTKPVRGYFRAN